jgi:hypothetical protein
MCSGKNYVERYNFMQKKKKKGNTFQKKWRQKGVIKITTEMQHSHLCANSELIYTDCLAQNQYEPHKKHLFHYCVFSHCWGKVFFNPIFLFASCSNTLNKKEEKDEGL